ncbi:MAG: hypothetical protein ACTMHZ_05275 [Bifidobacterium psychraerophilum]
MPWWIWLVITIFMFVMLGVGAWYAFSHALGAMKKVSVLGSEIGEKLAAMNASPSEESLPEPPSFTQPLLSASDRYAEAHARVIERKTNKRIKHMSRWEQWRHFNE